MKVTMNTTAASPDGVLLAGKTYDIDRERAEQLIAAGFANPGTQGFVAAALATAKTAVQKRTVKRAAR